jgi:O-succinylbenzoate synthase
MGLQELAAQPSGGVPVTNDALVCMDYAVKREERFDPERIAIVIFTAGTTGIPKATLLSWENLTAAADAANRALSCDRYTVWQLVLPMSHIDGFQVMARSLQNGTPFIVYSRYEPRWLLNDVLPFRVTHIGVVDRVLQDLLNNDRDRVLSQYHCLLLGGAAPNDKTLRKARRARARIYASYSMTETSGMIALAPVNRSFDGGMKLLPGYEVHIMKPNTLGQGSVHVKGPGVFEGYLNSRGSFTLDGWYVTGDRGSVDRNGYVHLMPGTANLIMVGGEIVNPESIRRELLKAPGVKDAFVFGTSDERWGQRAVAFVEADWTTENLTREHEDAGLDPDLTGLIPATEAT